MPTPVREVDPNALLLLSQSFGHLQPYLPREVDTQLNEALTAPGMVLIPSQPFSGARRSAYEALLRNMPDALLVSHDSRHFDGPDATILWADYHDREPGAVHQELPELQEWQARAQGRWVIILIDDAEFRFVSQASIEARPTRVVQIQSTLTAAERAGLGNHGMDESVSTVEQIFIQGSTNEMVRGLVSEDDQLHDSEPTPTRPQTRQAVSDAGYHPDTDEGDDHLGVTPDVHMLADLIASRRVVPPLSIGLFGGWGAGKSFFMRRMRARINELAQATAVAERAAGTQGPAVSAYCSQIRQITFNAWHYAESNLWASLATHLLDSLASGGTEDDLERRAKDLAERRRHQRSLLDQLSSIRVERMLLTAHLERQDRRAPRPGDIARTLVAAITAEDWVTAGSGRPGNTTAQVRTFIDEATGLSSELRNLWRHLVRSRMTAAVVGLGAAAAIVVFVLANSAVWPAVIAALTVAFSVLPALRKVRTSVSRIRSVGEEVTARAEVPARARLAELDAEQDRLEQAVADLAPSQDLTTFARLRDQSQDYRRHLSVVSLVRRDLETFAAMLAHGAGEDRWNAGPERIVLYIDDLDRCPPDVVVKVPEAVHLLLAQPVFTIVVAADPNWLLGSLNEHYGAVLQGGDTTAADSGARHYLEKIFQVTLTLAPMTSVGYTRLITNLLQDPEDEQDASDHSAPQSGSSRAPGDAIAADKHSVEERGPGGPVSPSIEGSSGMNTEPIQPAQLNLRPQQLDITDEELDFIATLAPLVRSPRSAKRLINLYRLLRARLDTRELADFLEGSEPGHRAALILLALTVGPSDPSELFKAIENSSGDTTWQHLLSGFPQRNLVVDAPSDITAYQRWLPTVRRFSFTSSMAS